MIQVMTSNGLQTLPRKYSYWKHRNGGIYQVTSVTNLSDRQEQYPMTINYIGPNGKEWSKTAYDWFEKMSPLTKVLEDKLFELIGNPLIRLELMTVWYGIMQLTGDGDGQS